MAENQTPQTGVNVVVGPSTVAGSGVTLVAFVVAAIAYATGARDEATLGALATGVVALVTTLAGRFAQAIAAVIAAKGVRS